MISSRFQTSIILHDGIVRMKLYGVIKSKEFNLQKIHDIEN